MRIDKLSIFELNTQFVQIPMWRERRVKSFDKPATNEMRAGAGRLAAINVEFHFILQPSLKDFDYIGFLVWAKGAAFRDLVPFFQAAAAAAGCCMLRHKNRVPPERGLFAVIFKHRWRQAFCDKVSGMKDNRWQSFGMQIDKIFALEVEFAAES